MSDVDSSRRIGGQVWREARFWRVHSRTTPHPCKTQAWKKLPERHRTRALSPQTLIDVAEMCYYNARVREAGVRPVMVWKDDFVFPAIARSPDTTYWRPSDCPPVVSYWRAYRPPNLKCPTTMVCRRGRRYVTVCVGAFLPK